METLYLAYLTITTLHDTTNTSAIRDLYYFVFVLQNEQENTNAGNRPHGFSGVIADRAAPEDFIEALVIQQNDRSAKLLDTMLTYLPKYTCMPDKESIINEVIRQIWEHPCSAYVTLREKIRPEAEKFSNRLVSIPIDTNSKPPGTASSDTTTRVYYWFN